MLHLLTFIDLLNQILITSKNLLPLIYNRHQLFLRLITITLVLSNKIFVFSCSINITTAQTRTTLNLLNWSGTFGQTFIEIMMSCILFFRNLPSLFSCCKSIVAFHHVLLILKWLASWNIVVVIVGVVVISVLIWKSRGVRSDAQVWSF